MTTSITKNNALTLLVPASVSRLAKRGRYKWYNIITWTIIICLAVVWVWGMAIAIRKIYIRLTVTTIVAFEKGGQQ